MPTGRWSLSLSPEVFHFTPHYTRLFPSACCLSFTELSHPFPLFAVLLLLKLSSLHACLLCWLHVKCQVQSQLTDPLCRQCTIILDFLKKMTRALWSMMDIPSAEPAARKLLLKAPTLICPNIVRIIPACPSQGKKLYQLNVLRWP